jgi:hypothetical protein
MVPREREVTTGGTAPAPLWTPSAASRKAEEAVTVPKGALDGALGKVAASRPFLGSVHGSDRERSVPPDARTVMRGAAP